LRRHIPEPFVTFIRVIHMINLDLGIIPSTACVVKFDFYDIMMMWSLLPVVVVGIGVLRVAVLKLRLSARQGLTLVHFPAQPKPFWSYLPVTPC